MRKSTMAAVLLAGLAASSGAWAVNKCTGPDGKVTFQDAPCATTLKSEVVRGVQANGAVGSVSARQLPFKALGTPPDLAQQLAASAMSTARQRLKDPDSAKFANVRTFSYESMDKIQTMVCGEMNAKNSYGAYAGSKAFWVSDGVFTEAFDYYRPGSNMQFLMGDVQNACLREGAAVTPPQ